jgi:hypothetical protein
MGSTASPINESPRPDIIIEETENEFFTPGAPSKPGWQSYKRRVI